MMMTFITQGGEGRGEKRRRGKLRKAKAEAVKRGLVARSCARSGRKELVGEVKGIEIMGMLVAGRGARERGGRNVIVHSGACLWSIDRSPWSLRPFYTQPKPPMCCLVQWQNPST